MTYKKFNDVYLSFYIVILVVSALIFSIVGNEKNIILFLSCAVFLACLIYAIKSFYKNIFFLSYLVSFFTFLLGGQILSRFMDTYWYKFSDAIEYHTDLVLLISLLGIFIGYFVTDNIRINNKFIKNKSDYSSKQTWNTPYIQRIRQVVKPLFLVSYVAWIVTLLDIIIFVYRNGYYTFYVSYSSSIPMVIRAIGNMAPMLFCVFLATMPSKTEAKNIILMYGLYILLSLGTGRRLYFMTGVLFILSYMLMRNVVAYEKRPWIKKRTFVKIVIMMPVLLGMMYLFEYIRATEYVGSADQYSPVLGFFIRQGTSVNVIKYGELFANRLDPDAFYSMYNTLRWFSSSLIGYILDIKLPFVFEKQSIETAFSGSSLADFVSFNALGSLYVDGSGYGSCYIEELYIDFGYVGVFLGNILYGVLICTLLKNIMGKRRIYLTAIGLYMVSSIFVAPRSNYDAFFGGLLYISAWGPLVAVFVITKIYKNFHLERVANGVSD